MKLKRSGKLLIPLIALSSACVAQAVSLTGVRLYDYQSSIVTIYDNNARDGSAAARDISWSGQVGSDWSSSVSVASHSSLPLQINLQGVNRGSGSLLVQISDVYLGNSTPIDLIGYFSPAIAALGNNVSAQLYYGNRMFDTSTLLFDFSGGSSATLTGTLPAMDQYSLTLNIVLNQSLLPNFGAESLGGAGLSATIDRAASDGVGVPEGGSTAAILALGLTAVLGFAHQVRRKAA